jgi:hypothetical protein
MNAMIGQIFNLYMNIRTLEFPLQQSLGIIQCRVIRPKDSYLLV